MKRRKITDATFPLFEFLQPKAAQPEDGSMNITIRLRQAVSHAIKQSGKDRIDICAEIYKLTGIEISKNTLDGWSAESRSFHAEGIDHNGNRRWGIPAEIAPAFCQVCDDWEVLFIQAEAGHFTALKGKDLVRARLGLLKEEIAKKQKEMKELETALMKDKDGR